jgi:hypothetical protein
MLNAAVILRHEVQKAQGRERCTGGCLEVCSVGAFLMVVVFEIDVDAVSQRP